MFGIFLYCHSAAFEWKLTKPQLDFPNKKVILPKIFLSFTVGRNHLDKMTARMSNHFLLKMLSIIVGNAYHTVVYSFSYSFYQ